MADEFNKLSPEQVDKLAKTIKDAKDLTARQAEIIKEVLAGESLVGELRITYLNQYLDTYSKSLDSIIARKQSDLNDVFLIAEKKAKQFRKELNTDLNISTQKTKKQQSTGKKSNAATVEEKTTTSDTSSNNELKKLIDDLITALSDSRDSAKKTTRVATTKTTRSHKVPTGRSTTNQKDIKNILNKIEEIRKNSDAIVKELQNNSKVSSRESSIRAIASPDKTETSTEKTTSSLDLLKAVDTQITESAAIQVNNNISFNEPLKVDLVNISAADQLLNILLTALTTSALDKSSVTELDLSEKKASDKKADLTSKKIKTSNSTPDTFKPVKDFPKQQGFIPMEQSIKGLLPQDSEKSKEVSAEADKLYLDLLSEIQTKIGLANDLLFEISSGVSDQTQFIQDNGDSSQPIEPSEKDSPSSNIPKDAVESVKEAQTASEATSTPLKTDVEQAVETIEEPSDDKFEKAEKELKTLNIANSLEQLTKLNSMSITDQSAIFQKSKNGASGEEVEQMGPVESFNIEGLDAKRNEMREKLETELNARILKITQERLELEALRVREQADIEQSIYEMQIESLEAVQDAQIEAQKATNDFADSISYQIVHAEEIAQQERDKLEAENRTKSIAELKKLQEEELKNAIEAKKAEFEALGKDFTVEDEAKVRQAVLNTYEDIEKREERLKQLTKERLEKETEAEKKAKRKENRNAGKTAIEAFKTEGTWAEKTAALKENIARYAEENKDRLAANNPDASPEEIQKKAALEMGLNAATKAVSDLLAQLEEKVNAIADKKGKIDTNLQGSNNDKKWGSYWDALTESVIDRIGVNAFVKQEKIAESIEAFTDKGIAYNIKQRAFLQTISEKIATTFNAADGTLLRLIRIQKADSTAGRLGMESALTAFLNEMFETSEYMREAASSVRASLAETQALMGAKEAVALEYEVQKWMGSMYSAGMSDSAVTSIANTLGQLSSGQIEGLTSGGISNLLVMAANETGSVSIADALTDGLDASKINDLLQGVVNYLAELKESSKDNLVVQQQLANVFGVKASDLQAATNLTKVQNSIHGDSKNYDQLYGQLVSMMNTIALRTSINEMATNLWENGMYSLAGSMANNVVTYAVYKMASLLDATVGGIDLPFVNVMGFGIDLNTTVSDLMRVAATAPHVLGMLGSVVSGLANTAAPGLMLMNAGISNNISELTYKGNSSLVGGGSSGSSESGTMQSNNNSTMVGNGNGNDLKNSTIQESEDSKEKQMIEAKEEAEENQADFLNITTLKIYELLDEVVNGDKTLRVKVVDYGLTKLGGRGSNTLSKIDKRVSESTFGDAGNNNVTGGAVTPGTSAGGFSDTGLAFGGWSIY